MYNILGLENGKGFPKHKREFSNFFKQFLTKEQWEDIKTKIRLSKESGIVLDEELDIILPDKTLRKVNFTLLPVQALGESVKYYGTVQDISNMARRNEGMYLTKITLDQIKEQVLWVKKNGSIYYSNAAVGHTAGYSKSEIKALDILDLLPDLSKEAGLAFGKIWTRKRQWF